MASILQRNIKSYCRDVSIYSFISSNQQRMADNSKKLARAVIMVCLPQSVLLSSYICCRSIRGLSTILVLSHIAQETSPFFLCTFQSTSLHCAFAKRQFRRLSEEANRKRRVPHNPTCMCTATKILSRAIRGTIIALTFPSGFLGIGGFGLPVEVPVCLSSRNGGFSSLPCGTDLEKKWSCLGDDGRSMGGEKVDSGLLEVEGILSFPERVLLLGLSSISS